ncbi:fructosamine-3-kinase-like [Clavelina lepadiformis]|uniref:protein-ribulosamine 3-kinase n=1 Tax=Clavelina lepadiformis TaxID=159417 RepID=A0ABP0G456_CLALP
MEEILKKEFRCRKVWSCGGQCQGGGISSGSVFSLDGQKVFVKRNPAPGSRALFDGECASLEILRETKIIRVPKPIKVFSHGDKTAFVMEYLMLSSVRNFACLGEKLAKIHLYNKNLKDNATRNESFIGRASEYVDRFGFHTTTCCGFIPLTNEWKDDWLTFYASNRLKPQIDRAIETYQDRGVLSLWPEIERVLPKLFPSDLNITPALLHGDFWEGNVGEVNNEPCMYDPACSYGHSEYDLGLAHFFRAFPPEFHDTYHSFIPKKPGFEKRLKVYLLFNAFNNWNHFGSVYQDLCISLMHEISNF